VPPGTWLNVPTRALIAQVLFVLLAVTNRRTGTGRVAGDRSVALFELDRGELNELALFVIPALNPPSVNVAVMPRAATAAKEATSPRLFLRMRCFRTRSNLQVADVCRHKIGTTSRKLSAE